MLGPGACEGIIFTGRLIEAEEACKIGLLGEVLARLRKVCSVGRTSWRKPLRRKRH